MDVVPGPGAFFRTRSMMSTLTSFMYDVVSLTPGGTRPGTLQVNKVSAKRQRTTTEDTSSLHCIPVTVHPPNDSLTPSIRDTPICKSIMSHASHPPPHTHTRARARTHTYTHTLLPPQMNMNNAV